MIMKRLIFVLVLLVVLSACGKSTDDSLTDTTTIQTTENEVTTVEKTTTVQVVIAETTTTEETTTTQEVISEATTAEETTTTQVVIAEMTTAEETTTTQVLVDETTNSTETSGTYATINTSYNSDIESQAPLTDSSEISPNFKDFVIFDGILYSNIANEPSWIALGYKYIKGDFFGEVLANSDERNLHRIENGTANFTPVGTKFYRFDEDPTIILADTADGLVPFLMIVGG